MVIESLLDGARHHPNKTVARDPLREWTYAEMTTFAKVFRHLIKKKTACDRLGIMLPGTATGLGSMLGTLWAGKTIVPLNFLLQPKELQTTIADAGIDLIITTRHLAKLAEQLPIRTLYVEHLSLKRRFLWQKLTSTPEPPRISPQNTAAIVYTSGTTGQPKGACLSYDNFVSNCRAAIEQLRITPDHHLLGILPPFHVFGLTVLHFLPILLGAAVTYTPRFSPQDAYRTVADKGVSILLAIPSMYTAIARLKDIDPSTFDRIHLAVSGGEPLPQAVYRQFHERTGIRLMEGYGLTETSPVISVDLPWAHRVGTVGPPLPGVQVEVRDDEGKCLPIGQRGELYVRGPLVMQGYLNQPDETARMIDQNGWLRTGDIVQLDDAGYIRITGRAKDLIIVGGENVYPREIEAVLEQHPAVSECAIIGHEDSSRGEVVVAFVVLNEGYRADANEMRTFCRDHLAGYKVPRQIHTVSQLPHGPSGKVLKRELKATFC